MSSEIRDRRFGCSLRLKLIVVAGFLVDSFVASPTNSDDFLWRIGDVVHIHQVNKRGIVAQKAQLLLVALWLTDILENDLDVMVGSAFVTGVLVGTEEPSNVETLRAVSLAWDPDSSRTVDPLLGGVDRLRIG